MSEPALVAALVMRRYASPNLSPVGRAYVEMCLRVASAIGTSTLYLSVATLTSQLTHNLDNLSNTSCADRMSFCQ